MKRAVLAIATLCLVATALTFVRAPDGASAATPIIDRVVIGYSVDHRPIVAYHVGDEPGAPTALLIGQIHGDEHAGVHVAHSIVFGDRSIAGLNLWVVPTMNPDGNIANTRQNAHHVDLNRNWPDHWVHLHGYYYSGPHPMSEPETRAMHAFLLKLRPHYVLVLHQPLYGVDTTDGGRLDPAFRNRLAHNLGLPEKPFRCNSFCHGSLTGWYTTHRYGIGETVEFGTHPTLSYLTGRARLGIVHAMGGRFGLISSRNPRSLWFAHPSARTVRVDGWTYDPDRRGTSLVWSLGVDGHVVLRRHTARPSPNANRTHHLTGQHGFAATLHLSAGSHRICTHYVNLAAGTGDPTSCHTVAVPAGA